MTRIHTAHTHASILLCSAGSQLHFFLCFLFLSFSFIFILIFSNFPSHLAIVHTVLFVRSQMECDRGQGQRHSFIFVYLLLFICNIARNIYGIDVKACQNENSSECRSATILASCHSFPFFGVTDFHFCVWEWVCAPQWHTVRYLFTCILRTRNLCLCVINFFFFVIWNFEILKF